MLPIRAPLKVFRYEVLRMPGDDYALSLWSEGAGSVTLKNIGLLWYREENGGRMVPMENYNCRVLEWDVFDAAGKYLGMVTMPPKFAPRMIWGNQIYGVWRDELDVQYVVRLRIVGVADGDTGAIELSSQ